MRESDGVADAKKGLRRRARELRAEAHSKGATKARAALRSYGLDFLNMQPGVVSGFQPYDKEIDCTGLLERLAGEGWTTSLPVVLGAGLALEFRVWRPGEPLEAGAWGIPAPPAGVPVVFPQVLLVPLLAFDAAGFRLGYGGGFYDRSLQAMRARMAVTAVGVAFAAQEVDEVPRAGYDQPLDWVLTEEGARRFPPVHIEHGSASCG